MYQPLGRAPEPELAATSVIPSRFVPPKFTRRILTPSVIVLEGGALGRSLSQEGRTLTTEMSALVKCRPEISLPLALTRGRKEK